MTDNITVKDIQDRQDLQFVSDSQNIECIKDILGTGDCYDSYFVQVIDGDYGDIYGMYGVVPYLDRNIYKVH